jgi:alpha-1,3/alpha-1,6-mannosyltransferase
VLLRWPFFDVILVDQVSVVIPLLKLMASSKVSVFVCMKCLLFSDCSSLITIYMLYLQIIFYCHFPDLLLAQHTSLLRRLYRKPIDMIEEITTGTVF